MACRDAVEFEVVASDNNENIAKIGRYFQPFHLDKPTDTPPDSNMAALNVKVENATTLIQ